ncbi:16S rRNA (cytosine(967)-C(5))-methyltransferase RsmB [Tepidibacillus sp. LV47]|uniref:16S rRNA (cytosine(967)-C(5))-methyltransferase RsmB n=1 Tax=Tepidibacillus sp. LV47 TaxID=3398228 RepID=UPI003AAE0A80
MTKKLTAREIALDVLTKVDTKHSYSNLQLNQTLQKNNLSRVDANFATQLIYGTIQHLNRIDWMLKPFVRIPLAELEPWIRNLLRLSIYQIWYLDKIPSHAVVNEAVNIAKKWGHKGIAGMVNAVLRHFLRKKEEIKIPTDLPQQERIALEYSHPEWLVSRLIEDYGIEEAEQICRVNNLPPYQSLRVNPLKISRDEMIKLLKEEYADKIQVWPSPLSEQGIMVKGVGNLALSKWYEMGYFTIQDGSSMLVAEVLDPKPGMTVLDAAAAPGGKTTHIAEKMLDKGKIIAADIHKHKIPLIEEQQKRLGLHIIETIHADARELREHFPPVFDRILLDVPCSGLGVIRRKPDLKWAKTKDQIQQITTVQREILDTVSPLLKPGGVLVYSTCTMVKEENQDMVLSFIKNHPEFELDYNLPKYLPQIVNERLDTKKGMIQILPHHFDTDGFFISRLIKTQ